MTPFLWAIYGNIHYGGGLQRPSTRKIVIESNV